MSIREKYFVIAGLKAFVEEAKSAVGGAHKIMGGEAKRVGVRGRLEVWY